MTDMVCGRCGMTGIKWHSLAGPSPYTKCPHCGGVNCQKPPEPQAEPEEGRTEQGAKS